MQNFFQYNIYILLPLVFILNGIGMFNVCVADTPNDSVIPRKVFFSDPERTSVQISPDGKHLSYLAPHKGVLNVWVGNSNNIDSMQPITHNTKRGIAGYTWAYTNQHIIYVDDEEGDENWRIYRADIKTGEKKSLVSFAGVQARILARSQHHPEEILIAINQRNPEFHDIFRLNILTGKSVLILENDVFSDFVTDENLNLKAASQSTKDGGAIYFAFGNNPKDKTAQRELFSISPQDMFTTNAVSMNKKGDILYMLDSRNRNTAALMAYDLKTQKSQLLAENNLADISEILVHPTQKIIQAVASNYEKPVWQYLDKSIVPDMDYLKKIMEGELILVSRSIDDKVWIIAFQRDNGSPHYYRYDRSSKNAKFLFASRPLLDKMPLSTMDPVVIPARDHLPLVSYLSLPKNIRVGKALAKQPVPMVLLVHGGPSARDEWGYDAEHQWLANRGYAVLSVNYRGSTGFGKQFANAGNGEWARKMHYDLLDAVQWAIQKGITTKDKIAIMGGSYGGYATLVGLTHSPDTFACGVDIVGPSNLETLMKSIPPYWKPFYALLKVMIGADPETEQGRQFLASRSPLFFVENIKKPLLIAQGANDPRVKQAESDQIVKAMKLQKIPVTYVLYPNEGHGFSVPENRISFYAITEAFLAKNLGGRFESVESEFKNIHAEIREGKQDILGF